MYKLIFGISFLFFTINCQNKFEQSNKQTKEILVCDTILNVDNSVFHLLQDTASNKFKILKQTNNSWEINIQEYWTSSYNFKDWNKDGYIDIVLRYHHAHIIILYSPRHKKFIKFGDVGELSDEVKYIAGTNLMYNFSERKYWYSELFDIDTSYKKRSYGIMISDLLDSKSFAHICIYKERLIYNEENETQFYRDLSNKKIVEKLNANDIMYNDSSKLLFTKEYWEKHWRKFIKP